MCYSEEHHSRPELMQLSPITPSDLCVLCVWFRLPHCLPVSAGGEGQLLESVLREELRFEQEEAAKAHGGAGTTARATEAGHAAAQVMGPEGGGWWAGGGS